jgi:acetyl-CoA carboxylase alpha subunit
MAWSLGLPTASLVVGRFASGTALIVAVATRVPATAAPTALRPPISA